MQRSEGLSALWLIAILLAATAIFWPALSGPFLLDDLVHFPKLGFNGSVDTLRKAYEFIFASGMGSGRPISYLSLLINDNTWPTDPRSFKYTNLMIHLLNGVLVFALARRLISLHTSEGRELNLASANTPALFIMAIWLIHPIQLSPTMLTIQRMTLLMGTFSLLALIFYLKGRWQLQSNITRGYATMSLGLAVFGILGVLSKEPAVMLVCYIIAIESTIFAATRLPRPAFWNLWYSFFILMPLALILGYFLLQLPQMEQLFVKREFNMGERLLTEARVLMEYIRIILLPSLSSSGPYHDDYLISRGLLDPPTTAISLLAIITLIVGAIRYRKKYPWGALAVLWFFLGHLLESTVLPLELYFEHRNYLPMLGPIIGIVMLAHTNAGRLRKTLQFALALFILLESTVSISSANVWGDRALIANIWAHEHPGSVRAQLDAIRYWLDKQDVARAKDFMNTAIDNNPNDAGLRLYQFLTDRCGNPEQAGLGGSMDTLRKIIPHARFDHASLEGIRFLVSGIKSGRCRANNQEALELIDLYLTNPRFKNINSSQAILYQEKSSIYLRQGDLDNTIKMLDLAYKAMPIYTIALNQAYLLMTAGLSNDALRYIEIARLTKPFSPGARLWQEEHISEVEDAIIASMNDN